MILKEKGLFGVEVGDWEKSPGKFPIFLGISRGKLEIPQAPVDTDPRTAPWKILAEPKTRRGLAWKHLLNILEKGGKHQEKWECGIPAAHGIPEFLCSHYPLFSGIWGLDLSPLPVPIVSVPLSRIPWKTNFGMLPGRSFGIRSSLWISGIRG